MKYLTGIFLIFIFWSALISTAQTRRENESYCGADKDAKKVEIAPASLEVMGLRVGHSTFKDVRAKLGPSKETRVSREEESDVAMCYVSPSDGTVLIFYTGVMGGGEDITWFAIWSREAAFPHTAQCSPSKLISRSVRTSSGLRLDLTKSELQKIAGIPTQTKAKLDAYDFICRRKMTPDEITGFKTANGWDVSKDPYFDRMSWIRAWYKNSTASRIEIGEIESY
jgi:hypothetical protein